MQSGEHSGVKKALEKAGAYGPDVNLDNYEVGSSDVEKISSLQDVDEELKKLEAELAHQEGFLRGVMGKLNNERFVANAKPEIVELERKKKADAESRIATIKEAMAQLRG